MIENSTMTRWKADVLITMLDSTKSKIEMVSRSFEQLKESKDEIIKEYSLIAESIEFMCTRKQVEYTSEELTIDEEVVL